ncbi:hydrogenase maturation protease [Chloroherpeton thalassium ATCC 35110]|uniref:Hydrogenase maturation protease n=2 Tax=Chloroherpeton thalassium TaxID=100716 RepID=B3QZ42_CHLT3|nr:HyaD/HybD family hydrogenase maturation endopeptidase [Chloroherpeton thalassium]ACF13735.1 hydrogenase maturation protease [Chloroherpeton thalassium ATCC 35110]
MKKINVLGLGNIIFGDEGFGVEAVKALEKKRDWPAGVSFIDGGTQGIYLLDYIEAPDCLLIYDALIPVEYEFKVYTYFNDELPAFIYRKMSSHQAGLSELLSLARLHDKMPKQVAFVGIPPKSLEMGIGLSAEVKALMEAALSEGQSILDSWLAS